MSDLRYEEPKASKLPIAALTLRVTTLVTLAISLGLLKSNSVTYDRGESQDTFDFKDVKTNQYVFFGIAAGLLYTLVQLPFALCFFFRKKPLINHNAFFVFEFYGDKREKEGNRKWWRSVYFTDSLDFSPTPNYRRRCCRRFPLTEAFTAPHTFPPKVCMILLATVVGSLFGATVETNHRAKDIQKFGKEDAGDYHSKISEYCMMSNISGVFLLIGCFCSAVSMFHHSSLPKP